MSLLFDIQQLEEHRYEVRFNASHEIFIAHFPGNPITPAACLIDLAAQAIEIDTGTPIKVTRLKNAKFLRPITPQCRVCVELLHKNDQLCDITIKDSDTVYAKMSITYLRSDTDV